MSGSSQALIFIPIVVMAALAIWLILVFYADSHPGSGAHSSPPELTGAAPGSAIATGEAPRITGTRYGAPMHGTPASARPPGPPLPGGTTTEGGSGQAEALRSGWFDLPRPG